MSIKTLRVVDVSSPRVARAPAREMRETRAFHATRATVSRARVGMRGGVESMNHSRHSEPADEGMSSKEEVERLLVEALAPTSVEVVDVSGDCGSAFDVHVTSAKFAGMNRLAKHRLIHDALSSVMGKIHALSVKTAKEP